MNDLFALEMIQKTGALVQNSHFVYSSGRHGKDYVNKDAIYSYPFETYELCDTLANKCLGFKIDVVVGPALGGIVIAQWVAYHLVTLSIRDVRFAYAEKKTDGSGFVLKRGYESLVTGKDVLIVEDVLTTGASVVKVVEAVREAGGNPVAIGAFINRGNITEKDLGVPRFIALVNLPLESWEAKSCELCQKGVPINNSFGKSKTP